MKEEKKNVQQWGFNSKPLKDMSPDELKSYKAWRRRRSWILHTYGIDIAVHGDPIKGHLPVAPRGRILERECTDCGEMKPIRSFLGSSSRCRACDAEARRKERESRKPILPAGHRKCVKCGEVKSEEAFNRDGPRRRTNCRTCQNIQCLTIYHRKKKAAPPKPIPTSKTCTKCNEAKPLDAFSFERLKGRHKSRCKKCLSAYSVEHHRRKAKTIAAAPPDEIETVDPELLAHFALVKSKAFTEAWLDRHFGPNSTCKHCQQSKPHDEFTLAKGQYTSTCLACSQARKAASNAIHNPINNAKHKTSKKTRNDPSDQDDPWAQFEA